ncbi:hypothetical protein GCM10027277_52130 [Pseudoduganella ginsengisoli]|uniref:Matrixin family metalloprotease n=1 Tax=Pseudoduganella ginsengisoli TaxID=1462440 RepID=A0A6L6Q590_9BURK|nr:matrixin family metalloprotease [Pseudoduganella ginsengisoli]MTW04431.1 matrixin family metalloprotease [Pseudoduganella ginsengisoli]
MPTVDINLPIFQEIKPKITQAMIDLINKSPTLVSQVLAYNDRVVAGTFSPIKGISGEGSAFIQVDGKPYIKVDISSSEDWISNVSFSYATNQGTKTISPAGQFVGLLSHELGHFNNMSDTNKLRSSVSKGDAGYAESQASFSLYSEGLAAYNNWVTRKEITANGGEDIQVRGANYQYVDTPTKNIYSNMLATMDTVASGLSGADPATLKSALADIAAGYIANQHPTTSPTETYWNLVKKTYTTSPAPSQVNNVTLQDANHDGYYDKITETKADGSQAITLNGTLSLYANNVGINVVRGSNVSILGSGLKIDTSDANVSIGGNGKSSSDAALNTVNAFGEGGKISTLPNSRTNVLSYSASGNIDVTVGAETNTGVYGGREAIYSYEPTANLWIGYSFDPATKIGRPIYVNALNGGTVSVVDNSKVFISAPTIDTTNTYNSSIYIYSNSLVDIRNQPGRKVYMQGHDSELNLTDMGDSVYLNGNHNHIDLLAPANNVYNKGVNNSVNGFTKYNNVYNYGSYLYVWRVDTTTIFYSTDSNSSANATSPYPEFYFSWGFGGDKKHIIDNIQGKNTSLFDTIQTSGSMTGAMNDSLEKLKFVTDHSIPYMANGNRWATTKITWSFGDASSDFTGKINGNEKNVVRDAFAKWENATGIDFVEVKSASKSDIKIGWSDLNSKATGALGITQFSAINGNIQAGAVIKLADPVSNSLVKEKSSQLIYQGTDSTLEQVALHEIGHVLGLEFGTAVTSIENFYLGKENREISDADVKAIYDIYPELSHSAALIIGPDWSNPSGLML